MKEPEISYFCIRNIYPHLKMQCKTCLKIIWNTCKQAIFLLQLGSNGREASLPEKGATEATSCPKGGNMWRHWYGLTQAWGSPTYFWILGQNLPRCREEGCQQNLSELCQRKDTGLPRGKPYRGRIHTWDYPKGNQAIRTPSTVQGLTGDPGELTPVLGLASDCSAQSDCRGCLEDSTRVHRPGNWTGGEKEARIPGWGGMAQQAWHWPVLPAHCLLPNTREETGSTRRL